MSSVSLASTAIFTSLLYLGLLFGIASWGDRRADQGRSVIDRSWIYTLSLGVYCTAWTYFGSIGSAARFGLAFLPIYLGPTLAALLFFGVLRKILTIAKAYGSTSIADFASARYGKSSALAGLVTIAAIIGIIPYIALQLKGVAASIDLLLQHDGEGDIASTIGADSAFLVASVLAAFAIFFGTRHTDATEHHQGMVLAVAFESVVKLVCFLAVGIFVTWGLFAGPADLLAAVEASGHLSLLDFAATGYSYGDWFFLTLAAGIAAILLPRQFQVMVIENRNARHVDRATWMFPLYLLAINIFVLPIALGGLALGNPASEAELFIVSLPLRAGEHWLSILAYLGGLSAATAMVIVETIALSTMLSNDLVMPVLLRLERLGLNRRPDLTGLVLAIRRAGILLILLFGYIFFRIVGEGLQLVSIGLIAFDAVAQFAPLIILGIMWRNANLKGAICGLVGGFLVWAYTLVLPAFVAAGVFPAEILSDGPWGIDLLRPTALFGVEGLGSVSHALVWSLAINIGLLVIVSLLTEQSVLERLQANLFVEVDQRRESATLWQGQAEVGAIRDLLVRFLGRQRADAALASDAARRKIVLAPDAPADGMLVELAERELSRAIGAASARIVVSSVVRGEEIGADAIMEILDEAQKVLEYSHRLEVKSRELEEATAELRLANERLQQLDRLKDDFLATVSHELRTPLTSIRSFSEILLDNADLAPEEQRHFLAIVIRESERLTRLINDVLDLSKIESGRMEWQVGPTDLGKVVEEAVAATSGIFTDRGADLVVELRTAAPLETDHDRLVQVVINLLSNASKFVPSPGGRVAIELVRRGGDYEVRVEDNGPGVPPDHRAKIFEKFCQVTGDLNTKKPKGTGLGLTICREIVQHFGGRIWVEDARLGGAALCFTVPVVPAAPIAIAA